MADLNSNTLTCTALNDADTMAGRKAALEKETATHGGVHPNCGIADTRLLYRAHQMAVPATRGGGLHPNRVSIGIQTGPRIGVQLGPLSLLG